MTDKELKKLRRAELLELMLEQSREIDRLRAELSETKKALESRELRIEQTGSIAEAAAVLNGLFETAQATASLYLENVERICDERAAAAGRTEVWREAVQELKEHNEEISSSGMKETEWHEREWKEEEKL